MLPFVRPLLAAALFCVPPLLVALFDLRPGASAMRFVAALLLVALPFAAVGAYASGWVARTRTTGDVLFRGAMVGLSGSVNACVLGFLLARSGQARLGTAVLAAGVFVALPSLATGAVSGWLHRRWS